MGECFRCGREDPVHDKLCGFCYFEIVTLRETDKLRMAEELKEEHLRTTGMFLEDLGHALILGVNAFESINIGKIQTETTVERDGVTYGISFMMKPLNSREEQEWEKRKTETDGDFNRRE